MSDMGFLPAVRRLLEQTHPDRQVLLFSATLDGAVGKLAAAACSATRCATRSARRVPTCRRHSTSSGRWSGPSVRRSSPTSCARSGRPSCSAAPATAPTASPSSSAGSASAAAAIHGDRSQAQRDRALQAFAAGHVPVLVATDVAARGVHVDDVAGVVHFDPPADGATYVHRSGRTARAGASGVVVSLIEPAATKDARKMQREVGIDTPIGSPDVRDAPGADDRTRCAAGAGAGIGIGIDTSAVAEAGERPPDRHGHHVPRRPRLRLHRRRPRQGAVRPPDQHRHEGVDRPAGRVRRASRPQGPRGVRRRPRLIARRSS